MEGQRKITLGHVGAVAVMTDEIFSVLMGGEQYIFSTVTVYQFVSEVLDSAASSLSSCIWCLFTCTVEPGLSPSMLLLLVICDMETGINLIWVFLAFVPFAMFFCVKDTRFISLGMGVVGLRAASLCTKLAGANICGVL